MLRRFVRGLVRRVVAIDSPHVSGREEGPGFYDGVYAVTDAYRCPYHLSHYYFLWSVIVDRIRRAGIKRVLEIGCGSGQLARYLLDQRVEEYTGLDFSPKAIELAKIHAPHGRFVIGNALQPDIHQQVDYEVVICTEVLEHINDDLGVVSSVRPGSRCLCSVPNFPYEGHVRHFIDDAEVRQRYEPFFAQLDVMTFMSPRSATDAFFLMDGVRNEYDHRIGR